MEVCKLCNKHKKLVNSHIFPEFMFKPLLKEGRYKIISMQNGNVIKEAQKGIYEKLLCAECEKKIIGSYEDHVENNI